MIVLSGPVKAAACGAVPDASHAVVKLAHLHHHEPEGTHLNLHLAFHLPIGISYNSDVRRAIAPPPKHRRVSPGRGIYRGPHRGYEAARVSHIAKKQKSPGEKRSSSVRRNATPSTSKVEPCQ